MKAVLRITFVLLGLAYPILVYFGLRLIEPRQLALVLGGILVLRLFLGRRRGPASTLGRAMSVPLALLVLAYSLTFVFNDGTFFLYVPALFAAALFLAFARSLFRPPAMVEVFARLRHEHLDEEQIAYCRKVTVLWSAFFLLNGSISLGLAVRGDLEAWTLYNGLIGYILVGLLFAGELVYRHFRFAARRQAAALAGNPGLVLDPQRLSRDAGDGWLEMRLRVPEDLSYLQGHFDEFPVVAGVVQLQWISELASELLGRPAVIRRMEQIKFHQVMQPGQAFSARLEHDPARSRISYVLQDGDRRFASGRLILGP